MTDNSRRVPGMPVPVGIREMRAGARSAKSIECEILKSLCSYV